MATLVTQTSLLLEKHKDGLNETIIYYKYTQIKTNQISLVHKHDQLAATTKKQSIFPKKHSDHYYSEFICVMIFFRNFVSTKTHTVQLHCPVC